MGTPSSQDIYHGTVEIGKSKYRIGSMFAPDRYDELAQNLILYSNCHLAFIVNLDKKVIFLKGSDSCDVDCGVFAHKLLEGGGIPKLAIGKVTANFIKFSKFLKKQ